MSVITLLPSGSTLSPEKLGNELEIENMVICPRCKSDVSSNESQISCPNCGNSYPIIDGVPRLVADGISKTTRLTFDRKWKLYDNGHHPLWGNAIDGSFLEISYEYPVSEERYMSWRDFACKFLRVEPRYFESRTILDAGCGTGWLSYTMARLGARVISTDLADSSLDLTSRILSGLGNTKVIQADLTELPFRKESFDSIVSLGVMHHTPNTKQTFLRLSKLLKPNGEFFIHVYERVQPRKENLTEMVRKIIHLFPKDVQLEICKHLLTVDFRLLKEHPAKRKFYRLLNLIIMLSKTPEESFDAYSPKYNHRHTYDEVASWYEEAGFSEVESLTGPSRHAKGKRNYGGALWMKGRMGPLMTRR